MTVHNIHSWTLDQATLLSGSAIVTGSSDLPRRITANVDYQQRVLELNPSGYWPLSAVTPNWGPFPDLSTNSRSLYASTSSNWDLFNTRLPGHQMAGDTRTSLQRYLNGFQLSAAAIYPEHDFIVGSPFSVMAWCMFIQSAGDFYISTILSDRNSAGWLLQSNAGLSSRVPNFAVFSGSSSTNVYINTEQERFFRNDLGHVVYTYNGGATNNLSSWKAYVNGKAVAIAFTGTPANLSVGRLTGTASVYSQGTNHNNTYIRMQDLAVWNSKCLTPTEVASLANVPFGPARFQKSFTSPATVKGVLLSGGGANDILQSKVTPVIRARVDDGPMYEMNPSTGRVLISSSWTVLALSASQTLTVDVSQTHYISSSLPFVGDPLGGGPALVFEEEAPPHPANIISIHSRDGYIEIDFDHGIEGTVQPTSDPAPAVQLGEAMIVSSDTLHLMNEPHEVAVIPAGPIRIAQGYNVASFAHLGFGGMSPIQMPSAGTITATSNPVPPPTSGYASLPSVRKLTWAPATDANIERYRIYSGPTLTGSWSLVADLTASLSSQHYVSGTFSYTLSTPLATHYRLDAIDAFNQSGSTYF
jgi:hypothetical protein